MQECAVILRSYDGPKILRKPVSDIFSSSRNFFLNQGVDPGSFDITVSFDIGKYLKGCGYSHENGKIEFPVNPHFQHIILFNRLYNDRSRTPMDIFKQLEDLNMPFAGMDIREIANTLSERGENPDEEYFGDYFRACSEYLANRDVMRLVEIPRAIHEASHKIFFEQTEYGKTVREVLYDTDITRIADSAKKMIRPVSRGEEIPDVTGFISENMEFQTGYKERGLYEKFSRLNGINEMLARSIDEKFRGYENDLKSETMFLYALQDAQVSNEKMATVRKMLDQKGYLYFVQSPLDDIIGIIFDD